MVQAAKDFGMSACGLTDHGTFAGAIDFLQECRKVGIKPILGMESYLCKSHLAHDKVGQPSGRKGNRHINLIAKNHEGFKNICTLSQTASLEGFYYDPRVDLELLDKYSEGVMATSACLSNVVNNALAHDNYSQAKKSVAIFKDIYGEDYYLEAMYHGIGLEGKILPEIQKLGKEMDVKVLASNDCHYVRKEDAEFHEVVMCISSGRTLSDPKRIHFPYQEFYFKSKEEMAKIFDHVPSMMNNTLEVAEKCDYSDITLGGNMLLPKFDIPDGFKNSYSYLCKLAYDGLSCLGLDESEPHKERLKTELGDIKLIWDTKRYDFTTYFLIVEDIMKFAKEKGIASGVRGSGCGSLLLKCLGIVDSVIDPIFHKLLWERFLGFDSKTFLSEDDFGINS